MFFKKFRIPPEVKKGTSVDTLVATSAGDILEVECSALLGHQLEKSPMNSKNFNLPITGT